MLELQDPVLRGTISDVITDNVTSLYRIDRPLDERHLAGGTLLVRGGPYDTGFPILHVESDDRSARVYTKRDGIGYDAIPARTWKIVSSVSTEHPAND